MIGNRLKTVPPAKPFTRFPPDALLVDLLTHRSAADVHRELTSKGYVISRGACERIRKRVAGCRVAESRNANGADPSATAERSSDALERALCKFYARTAERMGCKLETAAIILNYSPAQIAKMGRTA